jgi:hypothetical protein
LFRFEPEQTETPGCFGYVSVRETNKKISVLEPKLSGTETDNNENRQGKKDKSHRNKA